MDQPGVNKLLRTAWLALVRSRPELPSWVLSVGFHVVLFLVLGLTLRVAPRQGAMAERTADVGIVLKHQDGQSEYYEGEDDAGQATSVGTDTSAGGGLEGLFSDQSPIDPSDALPAAMGIIGPSALAGEGLGSARGALDGRAGRRGSFGGKARPRLFGVEGEGYKFVYVFDRSASMGGSGRSALKAAKTELIKSLESLEDTHQFQIIFYNETASVFNPAGREGRLAFATKQTKQRAGKFIGSITADGGTRHEDALKEAIKMQPDVIFFLTDGDEPRLSAKQLYEINRRSAGITINAVEFGLGPKPGGQSFLEKLARQNGGQYAYIDLSRLLPSGAAAR